MDKYKPKNMKQIIGQNGDKSNAKKLQSWLLSWHKNRAAGSKPAYCKYRIETTVWMIVNSNQNVIIDSHSKCLFLIFYYCFNIKYSTQLKRLIYINHG